MERRPGLAVRGRISEKKNGATSRQKFR